MKKKLIKNIEKFLLKSSKKIFNERNVINLNELENEYEEQKWGILWQKSNPR